MEQTANHITLCGSLAAAPAFSHENHGRRFFGFALEVPRLSGTLDILPVIAPEELLETAEITDGDLVQVSGQVRSFNSHQEAGRKLIISVYAAALALCRGEPVNQVTLQGAICKEPVYRRTPLGREICDIMLAVNRAYRRTDYLPCILWGRAAQGAAALPVGTRLSLTGRLQSRTYIKNLETGSQRRTAYEISAITAAVDK